MTLKEPDFQDVLDARRVIQPHIHRTPLRRYPALCDLIGADVWVKHENFQVAGSFKVRGGLNLVARTTEAERARGFISASTGNHGQSVAFAARTHGSKATIVVPEGANPLKVAAMRALGARVLHHGPVFDVAREHAERMAIDDELRYVHPANEPHLIAGVATYTLEVHEDLGNIDYIFVPLGAGSGASGACIVSDTVSPSTRVVAVQSAEAPSAYLSWKQGELVDAQMETEAEGLATASSYEFPPGDTAQAPARLCRGERPADQRGRRPFHREHAQPDRIRRRVFPWRGDGDERDPGRQEGCHRRQRRQRLHGAASRFARGDSLRGCLQTLPFTLSLSNTPSVHPELVEGSRRCSWFDKLTTNGIR